MSDMTSYRHKYWCSVVKLLINRSGIPQNPMMEPIFVKLWPLGVEIWRLTVLATRVMLNFNSDILTGKNSRSETIQDILVLLTHIFRQYDSLPLKKISRESDGFLSHGDPSKTLSVPIFQYRPVGKKFWDGITVDIEVFLLDITSYGC